jgi:Haemolysin secretion/activation protein ShlB/FhaC/HecB
MRPNFFFGLLILSYFVLFFSNLSTFAQKKAYLSLFDVEKDKFVSPSGYNLQDSFENKITLINALEAWRKKQHEQGFLSSNIDSLTYKDTLTTAFLFVGKKYKWYALDKGNVPPQILEKIGYREKKFIRKTFDYNALKNIFEKILTYQENNGYPFATIKLDTLHISTEGAISGGMHLTEGEKYRFGELIIENDSVGISPYFLMQYLDIKPNAIFDKSKINTLPQKISGLPFVSIENAPFLTFENEKAIVHLLLKKKQASRFDAIVGILPNNATDAQRFTLTGNLNLDLQNTLRKGERLLLDFQRFKANQQQLKVQINYPYIANLPVGADFNLDIFRQDTFFTTIEYSIGARYLFGGNNFLKFFWQRNQNNIEKINVNNLLFFKQLPDNLDVDASAYGLEYENQQLDYRFNPRKGFHLQIKTDIGTRRIIKNNQIVGLKDPNDAAFDFNTLYDTLRLKSLRWQTQCGFTYFFPLMKQSTIKTAVRFSNITTPTPIYQNEQFRFGGNRLMRGFDENSLYATRFLYGNVEYRFLFEQNSFFSVFSDISYLEDITKTRRSYNTLFGFGAGVNFATKAGIFTLNYALGKQNKNPIDLQNGKIHFGYVNLF